MLYPVHIVGIYLLLTDESYRKKNKYISKVNRTIRFRGNPKNYTGIDSKPDLVPINEYIVPKIFIRCVTASQNFSHARRYVPLVFENQNLATEDCSNNRLAIIKETISLNRTP